MGADINDRDPDSGKARQILDEARANGLHAALGKHRRQLRTWIFHCVGARPCRIDYLVDECISQCMLSFHGFRGSSDAALMRWVKTISTRTARREVKHRRHAQCELEAREYLTADRDLEIAILLSSLPEHLLVMCRLFLEGHSEDEVAAHLRISRWHVRMDRSDLRSWINIALERRSER